MRFTCPVVQVQRSLAQLTPLMLVEPGGTLGEGVLGYSSDCTGRAAEVATDMPVRARAQVAGVGSATLGFVNEARDGDRSG